MSKKFLPLVLFMLIFLSGCYDSREPNDIAYVVALGIDSAEEDNMYEFTIQFAKTTQISGGSSEEGGKEGSNILEMINVTAPTVYSGVNIANQVISKRFTLAHTKLVVISDELAKKGVKNLFDTFGRNSDIRPNLYIAISRGKAKEYLESVKPVADVNPVTYYRLIFESEYGGYVPQILLKDFYFQIDGTEKQNVLPLAGVNSKNKASEENKGEGSSSEGSSGDSGSGGSSGSSGGSGGDSGSSGGSGGGTQSNNSPGATDTNEPKPKVNHRGFDFMLEDYSAGNINVDKKNASEVIGGAIFKGDKMIGTLNNRECLLYNMMCGTYETSYVSFYNNESPDIPVTISLEQKRKPQISVDVSSKTPKINISLFFEGQLMSESTENPIENNIKQLESAVMEETKTACESFLKRTATEFGADIIGFGQWSKLKFPTYKDYKDYDWNSHYPDADFNVDVNFKLERIGFIDLGEPEDRKKEG